MAAGRRVTSRGLLREALGQGGCEVLFLYVYTPSVARS